MLFQARRARTACADYVLNYRELASRETAHRIRGPGGAKARPVGPIGRGEQNVCARGGARGGASGPARFRRELCHRRRRKDRRASRARPHLALHRPDPEQQGARDRRAFRLGALARPRENRGAPLAGAPARRGRPAGVHSGQRFGRGDQERRRARRSGAACKAGRGASAAQAARPDGDPRADAGRETATRTLRAAARAARPAEPRGHCHGHALDGHVGRSRSGDRRGRDHGARGHGDIRRESGDMKITFIGGGNMADALIGGLLRKDSPAQDIRVVDTSADARRKIEQKYGVTCFDKVKGAVREDDVVVFAVKPQHLREAASKSGIADNANLVISIAAGVRIANLSKWLKGHTRLARATPNTPAMIGEAVTREDRERTETVLGAVGATVWITDESQVDAVTAISGSGPAYVFYFIEAVEDAAWELGLPVQIAHQLVLNTFTGAARLASTSPDPVAVLRERVTSKGGTTERALASMAKDEVKEAIIRAIHAANERGKELGEELGKE